MAFNAKPSAVPEFAVNDATGPLHGQNNVVEPGTDQKNSGWLENQKPPRQYLNWIHRFTYLWIDYFRQFFTDTHQLRINEIVEETSGGGVTIDGLTIKDGAISGNVLEVFNPDINATTVLRVANGSTGSGPGNGLVLGLGSANEGVLSMNETAVLIIYTSATERLRLAASTPQITVANNARDLVNTSGYVVADLARSNDGIMKILESFAANWFEQTAAGGYSSIFYDITYGNGLYVAVGSSGEIQTSSDGITWGHRTAAGSYTGGFWGITYGNGLYVAVGQTGEIQTSPDGVTWTHRTAAGSYSGVFYDIAYGNGLYVAVGESGEIQTSSDGITWVHRTAAWGYSGIFYDITYGNGLYVAVGESAEIQTSSDGITWGHRTAAGSYTGGFRGIAYGNGLYVAVGASAEIQTSLRMAV